MILGLGCADCGGTCGDVLGLMGLGADCYSDPTGVLCDNIPFNPPPAGSYPNGLPLPVLPTTPSTVTPVQTTVAQTAQQSGESNGVVATAPIVSSSPAPVTVMQAVSSDMMIGGFDLTQFLAGTLFGLPVPLVLVAGVGLFLAFGGKDK